MPDGTIYQRAHIPIKVRTWAVIWCYSGYSGRSYIPVLGVWLIPGALGGAGPALNLAAKNSKPPRRDDSLFLTFVRWCDLDAVCLAPYSALALTGAQKYHAGSFVHETVPFPRLAELVLDRA